MHLDSFLEEIVKYTKNVVRIGGRCNNEKIKDFILDSSEKYYDNKYKKYLKDLDEDGENLEKIINDTMDNNILLNVQKVKKIFKDLYDKIINDFYKIGNIPNDYYINYNKIYILWNLIDTINDEDFQEKLYSLLKDDKKK